MDFDRAAGTLQAEPVRDTFLNSIESVLQAFGLCEVFTTLLLLMKMLYVR